MIVQTIVNLSDPDNPYNNCKILLESGFIKITQTDDEGVITQTDDEGVIFQTEFAAQIAKIILELCESKLK